MVLGALDDVGGHDAGRDDPPLAVGIGHEGGKGANALHESGLEPVPFLGGDQARDGIDEEGAVGLLAEADAALLGALGDLAPKIAQVAVVERAQTPR